MMNWLIAIRLFYALITFAALVSFFIPSLRMALVRHGKLHRDVKASKKGLILNILTRLGVCDNVPKHRFQHFYLWGCLWNGIMILWFLGAASNIGSDSFDTTKCVVLMCFQAHLLRRWYESTFIEVHSPSSTMLTGHYWLGLMFYTVTSLALLLDDSGNQHGNIAYPLALFLYASYNQNLCHRILAQLRTKSTDRPKTDKLYSIPQESWFQEATSPHYGFEIMIYVALLSFTSGLNISMRYCVIWTIVNLGILAHESKQWYIEKFPEQREFTNKRARIFPGLY